MTKDGLVYCSDESGLASLSGGSWGGRGGCSGSELCPLTELQEGLMSMP